MIYLDHHSTTPCDPRVVEAMLPFFSIRFANPANEIHQMGRDAKRAVDVARGHVAHLIGAQSEEVLFTSSATESNNLAILGLADAGSQRGRLKVLCSAIEHKSVLSPCHALAVRGFDASVLPVDSVGRLVVDRYRCALDDRTLVVAVQAANNEIGTLQNISALCALAHENGAAFHCDAAQAAGKVPINVDTWGVDFLSLSAHKMYGPKGIAGLFIRGGVAHSILKPLMYGGAQESELRPGTLNVPLIVGFGEACRIAADTMKCDATHVAQMRDWFEEQLLQTLPCISLNGDIQNRLPNNSSVTIPGCDAESLILSMPNIALRTGSACNSGAQEPSYVLRAVGMSHDAAQSTLRIGLGRYTTRSELAIAVSSIRDAVFRQTL